jgi:hypothetical protein
MRRAHSGIHGTIEKWSSHDCPKKIVRLGLLAAAISGSAMLAVPAVASAATAQPAVHSAAAHPNDCGGPCYPS